MARYVTVAEMQAVERQADAGGLSYAQMMENAGRGLAEQVSEAYAHLEEHSVLALVGSGNNGGDALVALAYLAGWGWRSEAYIVRSRPKDDPLVARLVQAGGTIIVLENDPGLETLKTLLRHTRVLLDGVLGTGFRLPLKGGITEVLGVVRQFKQHAPGALSVVAVDCPSGVDCDTGMAAPDVIPADITVTMAAVKVGLLSFPAADLVGELRVVGIGSIEGLPAWQMLKRWVVEPDEVSAFLPARPRNAHKGTFGTALIVAGSVNYPGAARLAGEAAYRVGAGLVTMCVPEPLYPVLAGHLPEVTWLVLPHKAGGIAAGAAQIISENLGRATAMLVGPGFGLQPVTLQFLEGLIPQQPISDAGLPSLVIDADGLKLLAQIPGWPTRLPGPAVLTPHPGEMAVLTGLGRDEIQNDRVGVAERFAHQWGHVVVLKGAYTVVASPDGQTAIIPVATPALARAGTGDVLAGLIVGLRAQGLDAFHAAIAGAWIHARAGLLAAEWLGNSASVLAGDVLGAVSDVMSELQG